MADFSNGNYTDILLPGLTGNGITEAVNCNPAVVPGAGFLTLGAQQAPA